jgi:hypothetical protein
MRALHPDDLAVQYRQKGIGWCTVYLMANIFRNCDFLEYLEYKEYRGCQDEQMDAMLLKYANDLSLGLVAISNPSYPRLPKEYVWKLINFDKTDGEIDTGSSIPIACYMLTVRLIDADIWHSVAVLSVWVYCIIWTLTTLKCSCLRVLSTYRSNS